MRLPYRRGSLTKEPPLSKLDATLALCHQGMPYAELLRLARAQEPQTHRDAPGLIKARFLRLDSESRIIYDKFLSLAGAEGLGSRRLRKIMFFLWAYRDDRLRAFFCQEIANKDGRWSVQKLTNLRKARFFEQFFMPDTAKKVRSNIEFFLQETGILNVGTARIDMRLEDGWLMEALKIVAQDVRVLADREAILARPVGFLRDHEITALTNATDEELLAIESEMPVLTDPLEDDSLPPLSLDPRETRPRVWQPRDPPPPGGAVISYSVNSDLQERATAAHQRLECLLAARAASYQAQCSQQIDLFFSTPHGTVLAEVKSCHDGNVWSQIRRGVAQLLEYSFLWGSGFENQPVTKLLLIETPLPARLSWLSDCLAASGIVLAWKAPGEERIVSGLDIPEALGGIVDRI